jgi:hypothetical protein
LSLVTEALATDPFDDRPFFRNPLVDKIFPNRFAILERIVEEE